MVSAPDFLRSIVKSDSVLKGIGSESLKTDCTFLLTFCSRKIFPYKSDVTAVVSFLILVIEMKRLDIFGREKVERLNESCVSSESIGPLSAIHDGEVSKTVSKAGSDWSLTTFCDKTNLEGMTKAIKKKLKDKNRYTAHLFINFC